MKIENIQIIATLVEMVLKYGPEAVMSAIAALNKEDPTLEDIQNLKIIMEPEDFK